MTASSFFVFCSRSLPLIAAAVLLTATAPASAQTTIRMTTTAGQPCIAVTDTHGLTLIDGSTDLQATGVTLTGAGCGGGSGVAPPTSPDGLTLTATPAAPTAGVAFSVGWHVSNATSCVGAVTAGSAANVAGWAQVSTPASPRSVTISAAGSYTLVLTCSNAGNPTNLVSPPLQLTVGSGGGAACTGPDGRTRLVTSDLQYGGFVGTGGPTRAAVDVREWTNIWGYFRYDDPPPAAAWPGVTGTGPSIRAFGRNNFLAAHFKTGSNTGIFGFFSILDSISEPIVDIKVSTTCGDFSPEPSNPGCVALNKAKGPAVFNFTFVPGNSLKCALQPNTDYYFNVKMSDPVGGTHDCPAGVTLCAVEPVVYFTNPH